MAKEPSNEQKAELAQAALDAVMDKAESMGLDRMTGLYGIARAMGALKKMALMMEILGPEAMCDLGRALENQAAADAVSEAEGILKGEM